MTPEQDDSQLFAEDFTWNLSQVRQCVPEPMVAMPERWDTESLLMLDLVETEYTRDEWMRIAHAYRELAETTLEAVALLEDQNRKLRALAKNMGEELMLRKPK